MYHVVIYRYYAVYIMNAWFHHSHFADSYFADSHFAESHFADSHFADSHFADSHFAESHIAESHFAESYMMGGASRGVITSCSATLQFYFASCYRMGAIPKYINKELHHHLMWRSHRTDLQKIIFCFSRAANIYIRFICKQTLKK